MGDDDKNRVERKKHKNVKVQFVTLLESVYNSTALQSQEVASAWSTTEHTDWSNECLLVILFLK